MDSFAQGVEWEFLLRTALTQNILVFALRRRRTEDSHGALSCTACGSSLNPASSCYTNPAPADHITSSIFPVKLLLKNKIPLYQKSTFSPSGARKCLDFRCIIMMSVVFVLSKCNLSLSRISASAFPLAKNCSDNSVRPSELNIVF